MAELRQADADVYLRLFELTLMEPQANARRWFFRSFHGMSFRDVDRRYPVGTPERDEITAVLSLYESAAALVQRGLLDEELFFAAPLGFDDVWEKIGTILPQWQEATDTQVWENVIWLGQRYERWKAESLATLTVGI